MLRLLQFDWKSPSRLKACYYKQYNLLKFLMTLIAMTLLFEIDFLSSIHSTV